MKNVKILAVITAVFIIGYLCIMPIGAFHEQASQGKYGAIQTYDWKYLLGHCDGDIHANLWGTMSLETFEKLERGKNEYFDYRFTDGDKKSLSIRVEKDHIRVDFDDDSRSFDGCSELWAGSIDIPLNPLSDLNGKYQGPSMHPGVTSNEPFRIMPWNRSFIKFSTNEKFRELFQ